jgi:hypothetical protein
MTRLSRKLPFNLPWVELTLGITALAFLTRG